LTYDAGEVNVILHLDAGMTLSCFFFLQVFDVIGQKGELRLTMNQAILGALPVGFGARNFARLAKD